MPPWLRWYFNDLITIFLFYARFVFTVCLLFATADNLQTAEFRHLIPGYFLVFFLNPCIKQPRNMRDYSFGLFFRINEQNACHTGNSIDNVTSARFNILFFAARALAGTSCSWRRRLTSAKRTELIQLPSRLLLAGKADVARRPARLRHETCYWSVIIASGRE